MRGRLRLHQRVKTLLSAGILGLSSDQNLREIQPHPPGPEGNTSDAVSARKNDAPATVQRQLLSWVPELRVLNPGYAGVEVPRVLHHSRGRERGFR